MPRLTEIFPFSLALSLVLCGIPTRAQQPPVNLPNGRILAEVPGHPHPINNLPTAAALSPDAKFAVFLHSGYGSYTSGEKQSLTVLNLETNDLTDFPDDRLGHDAHQSYFLGLAFSLDGHHLYASMASLTDPLGKNPGDTGNGIAVYKFENGRVAPEKFLPLVPRTRIPAGKLRRKEFDDVTYPAGLSVANVAGVESILVACNNSDEAILLNAADGKIIRRFDLSTYKRIPASLPYTTVMTRDGKRAFVSLWNASSIAELDLVSGRVVKILPIEKPSAALAGGSHPTALLLNHDDSTLYVALTNRDKIVALDTHDLKKQTVFFTKPLRQTYGGSDPQSLSLSTDEKFLFSANAISDSVSVINLAGESESGFIPTEWYPTVVLATPAQLLIATAKGRSSGPNPKPIKKNADGSPDYPYTPAVIHGSLAQIPLADLPAKLGDYTKQTLAANSLRGNADKIQFVAGENKIRHVIYIIRENRTYDQVFGDLAHADGDPSLTMYGEDITPNQHKLARQFGILDNFYDSGDVSGDGHVWSTSASVSDYVAKTWPIGYRSAEHTYDSEGTLLNGISADDNLPDAGEPTGGYLWKNFATHGVTYRHYGEYIVTKWCNAAPENKKPTWGPPKVAGVVCNRTVIKKGEPLEKNVGEPKGSPSPYPWEIPVIAKNIAAESELRGHFDPLFPDFEVTYPDQLRADEFLNEFNQFVAARNAGKDTMPQFILLRLPNDHTAGLTKNQPRPAASVADNDLAIGRVIDALSHSPYWDDTAVLVLEDDAQDGPDHIDSHRSIALVISKYSPLPQTHESNTIPFVDHTFYTTINMVRTIESLLGVPPMNSNDARAAAMTPLFSGPGTQPPFVADYRNRDNGLIYEMNTKDWKEGANLDFKHADAVDTALLNKLLWQDRMGDTPMPAPQHNVFPPEPASSGEKSKRPAKRYDPD
ncbi:MAG TPA: beta-propeller fold lactonase family protein [Candidatus Dormibacteraeota bacterium]|nr:beta-propeller fold lactonase family protein [Candidatus Dormibacteraeota bacterium]